MKKLTTFIAILLCAVTLFAQAPEKFTYQAVVRNASNSLVANTQVGMRVSILQGSASGSAVYVETQTGTTNANGLVTLSIGGGSVQQGTFANIDWANGPFFLKTETDPNGGSNYTVTTTQQLLSVPYALYAKTAENGFSGDYNDLTNTPQNVSTFNNDAGYITQSQVPAQVNADWNATTGPAEILNKPTIPTNVSAFNNDVPYLTEADIADLLATVNALLEQVDSLNRVVKNAGGQPIVLPNKPCPGMPTMMDYDSNIYHTVQIGWQCWMQENLRTTHYANGTLLNLYDFSVGTDVPYRYPTHSEPDSVPIYGYLYNWYATVQQVNSWDTVTDRIQGLCPNGWHVPSLEEWNDMVEYVRSQEDFWCDGDSNKIAKSLAHPQGWYAHGTDECTISVNPSQNNATGFSGRPAGRFGGGSSTFNAYQHANFWTATPKSSPSSAAWSKQLCWDETTFSNDYYYKSTGLNVRCLRDLPVQH